MSSIIPNSALLNDISLTNIDLINQDTNLFHRTGTGVFWIDSKDGTLRIGHTGVNILIQGDVTVDGTMNGATGPTGATGHIGSIGHTGPQGFATNTGATGYTGYTGPVGPSVPANLLALYSSNTQTIINNSYQVQSLFYYFQIQYLNLYS